MDSQRFRKPTYPTFSPIINQDALDRAARKLEVPNKTTEPIDDIRFPGYAAPMEDGRLVTDYSSHCAKNVVPSEYGNSMRGWLQHNGDAVIQVSRNRQAERAGAQYYMANTVIGPKQLQKCDEYECSFSQSRDRHTLGLERHEPVPELFGTFGSARQLPPGDRCRLTTNFEGGRNSPRGREYVPLGTKSFNPRNSQYGSSG